MAQVSIAPGSELCYFSSKATKYTSLPGAIVSKVTSVLRLPKFAPGSEVTVMISPH